MEDTVFEGKWWRFDSYEIRDGFIRPAEGAALLVDEPLADFQAIRAERKEARDPETKPPYVSLINAVEKIEFDDSGKLLPSAEQSLLEWCAANGLLGLLTHEVQQVSFAPRWQPTLRSSYRVSPELARQIGAVTGESPKPRALGPRLHRTESVYQRTTYGSFRFGVTQTVTQQAPGSGSRRMGQPLSERDWPRQTPSVFLYKLSTREWACEPIDSSWGRFFPDVADRQKSTFEYPEPYTETFWQMYGEPLHQFLAVARDFRDAFLAATGDQEDSEAQAPGARTSPLNSFVAPCGPTLLRTSDGMEQRLASPSLLGTLAIMAQQDLVAERRIFLCNNEKCRALVVAHTYQARFCSNQCRYAQDKRESRRGAKRDQPGKVRRRENVRKVERNGGKEKA